ncbi:hypothetical protein QZH41_018642 [Actinostola sp. cb2023]|nr:hypothetical protein QZH41_018642 [Actinostola sp. cb2023]
MSIGCSYWDEASSTWTTEGCKVRRRKQSSRRLSCGCNHMTAFGGSFLVAPNPIDLDKVWVGFLNPQDNIPVYVAMATVFLIYTLAVIWGRRADKRQRQSQDGIIVMGHGADGKPHKYQITVCTGQGRGAGTTGNVSITMVGEHGTSGVIPISELTKAKFNRGSQTRTTVCLPTKLGPLVYIQIWHDNEGSSPAWFLSSVNIRDIQLGEEWNFICDKWLAVESEDCKTDALLYVANPVDYNSYKRIYISKTARDLYDGHLWFSVAAKPPTSHFTRIQRCSCCLSLLFCTMMTNCMFYNITNEPDTSVIIIGPFKVSLRVLVIGIQSSLIVFPVNLLLTFLFRKEHRGRGPKEVEYALITQPVKVAVLAALLAFIIKERKVRKKSKYRSLKNARDADIISIDLSSEASTVVDTSNKFNAKPPTKKILQHARRLRLKQINTHHVIRDVIWYLLFVFLLMTFAFGHMDPLSFELTKEIGSLFRPQLKANSIDAYWRWLGDVVIPHMFAGNWYNGQAPGENEDDLIIDRASVLVGMARLRQLRIRDEKKNIFPTTTTPQKSYGSYSPLNEDKDFYKPGWQPLDPGTSKYNVSFKECPLHWRYQDVLTLDGMPFWGRTTFYSGGGYVADLGYFKEKAYQVLTELLTHKWLDRRTRACFLEFAVYNSQENLFSVATLLVEFLPTGSLLPYSRVDTLRVYRYLGSYSNVLKATEIIIALVMVVMLYFLVKNIYRQRSRFFKFFWNWVDMLQVVLGLLAVAMYFVKMVVLNKTMDDLKKNPFVFVNFQYTILLNEVNGYFVATVVFLTTLKFLRLLKYQSYIKLLEHVFASIAHSMAWFMVEFLLWFTPFVLFAYLVFGPHLYEYSTVVSSFESTLNSLLGAKSFYHLQETDNIMGPLMFIGFNLLMVLVLLNIFVAIITSSFNREIDDEFTRETEPELMLFLNQQLGKIFGFQTSGNSPPRALAIENNHSTIENDAVVNKTPSKRRKKKTSNKAKVVSFSPPVELKNEKVLVDKIRRVDDIASKIVIMEEVERRLYELLIIRRKVGQLKTSYRELFSIMTRNSR